MILLAASCNPWAVVAGVFLVAAFSIVVAFIAGYDRGRLEGKAEGRDTERLRLAAAHRDALHAAVDVERWKGCEEGE